MPVTATSNGLTSGDQTSLTIAHTSDANPLYVLLSWWQSGAVTNDSSTITGVTFNGVALTRLYNAGVLGNTMQCWRLASPSVGSFNVVMTSSAARRMSAGVVNLSGWPTAVSLHRFAAAGQHVDDGQPTVSVTSSVGAEVLDWLGYNAVSQTTTAGAGQTEKWSQDGLGGGVGADHDQNSAGSLKAGAAGAVTMSWALSVSGEVWGLAAMSFVDLTPVPNPTPNAAQAPCDPQAQVENGGKGKSGCNVGGIGGGHEYDVAEGLGDVPQHSDPADGETLTGKQFVGLEPWIELVHTDYPSGNKVTYRRAFEELADANTYQGGRKEAGLLSIGDVENALGNEQGGFEAATVDIELSDIRDRLIRGLADDQELDGDELRVKLATDPARAAGTAPRILARAIVQQPEIATGLRARLSAVDALFSDFGPFGPDRKDPFWTFGDLGSACPEMTSDTKAQVIPRLYGEKSDEGAVDPITSDPRSKGLLPGFYLGMFNPGGTIPTAQPTPGKSFEQVQAELQASVDAGTCVADYGSRIGIGGASPPADAAGLQALGQVPSTWEGVAAIIGGGDLNALMAEGETAAPTDPLWGFIATGLGPWFQFTGVYGSNLAGGDPQATPDRVQLDPAARSDILVYGMNWPFSEPYVSFTNDDGRVFWLSGAWVRGPLLDDHLNGNVTLAFNGIGTEEVGDGSGLPIMRAEDAKHHWLENHCFDQWSSGPYTTTGTFPQWEDGTPKVRSSSFLARQNFFKAQLGSEGLLVSWYMDVQQSTLETVRQFNRETESRMGVNADGQIIDFGLDETVDPSSWPRIQHEIDVFGPIKRTSGEERQNVITGSCDWDPDFETFRIGPIAPPYVSEIGVTKYKGRRKPGDLLDAYMLDNEDHFRWVLQRRLARLELGTTLLEVSGPMAWLDRDVGQGVLFNSEDGPGVSGYVDHPFIIMRRRTSLRERLVTYTLWDVRDVLIATAFELGLEQLFVLDNEAVSPVTARPLGDEESDPITALVLV